jgi:regulatory protein
VEQILNVAYRLLSYREHSTHQLEQKLKKRNFKEEDILRTLSFLQQQNYLNDERFAEGVARLQFNKRYGPLKIIALLSHNKIPEHIIQKTMECYSDKDFIQQARQQLDKKKYNKEKTDKESKTKLIRHLNNRGFSNVIIFKALEK